MDRSDSGFVIEIEFGKSPSQRHKKAVSMAQKMNGYFSINLGEKTERHLVRFEPVLVTQSVLRKIIKLMDIIKRWNSALIRINGVEYERGIYDFYETNVYPFGDKWTIEPILNETNMNVIQELFKKLSH